MGGASGRLTLWGLEVFVAAASEPSLAAAARRLGVGTATVSQQISNLETALGAELLDRAVRPLQLTPAGRMFLARAGAILDETRAARDELQSGTLGQLPLLRLGVIEDFDADVTPQLLMNMAGVLSNCRFELQTDASHVLQDALEARLLDVAVAADAPEGAEDLERHPVLQDPFVIVAPRGCRFDHWPDLPYLAYSPRHVMGRDIAAHLAREGERLRPRFLLDSYPSILALVAQGEGWSILTALGWRYANRFVDAVELHALPVAPLGRTVSVLARSGGMGAVPSEIAAQLRETLTDAVCKPAVAAWPFLDGQLRTL